MATGDYTTVAAVEAYAGITPSTATDALIQSLITAASAFMQTYMNRNIFQTDYVENYNGNGNGMLSLRNIPINTVASVSVDGDPIPASAEPRALGYVFDESILYYRHGIFCRGAQNVRVSYNAGYATVPADLAQVCIDLVTVKFKRRTKLDIQGETLAQQTITFVQGDLTQGAKQALDQWRDLRPVV